MKNILFLLMIVLLPHVTTGQTQEAYRYYKVIYCDVIDGEISSVNVVDLSDIIFLNSKDGSLTIYLKEEVAFKIFLVELVSEKTKIDSDGDRYKEVEYSARDNHGNILLLVSKDWPEYKNRDFLLVYDSKIIEFKSKIVR